jgi:hypothetical protein
MASLPCGRVRQFDSAPGQSVLQRLTLNPIEHDARAIRAGDTKASWMTSGQSESGFFAGVSADPSYI